MGLSNLTHEGDVIFVHLVDVPLSSDALLHGRQCCLCYPRAKAPHVLVIDAYNGGKIGQGCMYHFGHGVTNTQSCEDTSYSCWLSPEQSQKSG